MNVKKMLIFNEAFTQWDDHSKWAVTTGTGKNSQESSFICIGDMDRVVSKHTLLSDTNFP